MLKTIRSHCRRPQYNIDIGRNRIRRRAQIVRFGFHNEPRLALLQIRRLLGARGKVNVLIGNLREPKLRAIRRVSGLENCGSRAVLLDNGGESSQPVRVRHMYRHRRGRADRRGRRGKCDFGMRRQKVQRADRCRDQRHQHDESDNFAHCSSDHNRVQQLSLSVPSRPKATHPSTGNYFLHPARDPHTEWLHTRILKGSNQPFGIRFHQNISLIGRLPSSTHRMNQRDVVG